MDSLAKYTNEHTAYTQRHNFNLKRRAAAEASRENERAD